MSGVSTHHLYRAALYAEVPKIIFLSTQDVYSQAHGPGVIDESYPLSRPARSYYDLCKVMSEDIAWYYAARHGIRSIILRPGNFTGLPHPGPDFLDHRLRREDVAQCELRCLDYEPENGCEAFNVWAGNPFQTHDLADLQHRPLELIERYYPGAVAVMKSHGHTYKGSERLRRITRVEQRLGYKPTFTFERYLLDHGWVRDSHYSV